MRRLLLGVVTLGLVIAAAREAAACPPGPCTKYRQLPSLEATVLRYRRATPVRPPTRFDRAALTRYLATSSWLPVQTAPLAVDVDQRVQIVDPPIVQFVAPATARRAVDLRDRVVLVRQLELVDGRTYVAIDGVYYELVRCADGKTPTSCLVHVGALPQPQVRTKFATPP
jgi:hypothetical protein